MIIPNTKMKISPVPMKIGMTMGYTYSAIPRNWKRNNTKIIGIQKVSPMIPRILQLGSVPLLTLHHCFYFLSSTYKHSLDEGAIATLLGFPFH